MEKTQPQLNLLKEFSYAKTAVMAGIMTTGEAIALRPVVENLGLDWSSQLKRLKRDEKGNQLWSSHKVISTDGKSYEMVCMSPANFQDWLWNINVSENLNINLWEDYKKGLVLYLMLMLKVTLEEVSRLRNVERDYLALRRDTLDLIKTQEEKDQLSARVRELGKEYTTIQNRILARVLTDPNQLSLTIN
jgi:C4-dicarboxylate-specific signal transduction histidine kinase